MALNLSTPEGDTVEVTSAEVPEDIASAADAFHRAQANDPLTSDAMMPPKRPEKAAPAPGPAPKRGRPRKDAPEAARVTSKVPEPKKNPREPLKEKDYRPGLTFATDLVWLGGSLAGAMGYPKATAPAIVLKTNQVGLVESLNQAANQSHVARKIVEGIAGDPEKPGSGPMWMVNLGLVGLSMWSTSKQIQAAGTEEMTKLIETNNAMVNTFLQETLPAMMGQTAGA
jgi:hypothetical protein